MNYILENNKLILTVSSHGAEMISLVQADTGREMIWQADPEVWGRHAPLLFPYAGNLRDKKFVWQGREYAGSQHGFARDLEFQLAGKTDSCLDLVLCSNDETLKKFPFEFELHSIFTLEDHTVTHKVQVKNPGQQELRFGLGYHPGFMCPFDAQHSMEDYELRFDTAQQPVVIETDVLTGLVTGRRWEMLEKASDVIPVKAGMFDHDSICMSQLSAGTISIVEKDSGRSVTLDVQGFPYVLLWSVANRPIPFLCVEPWHSLPDTADATGNWKDKPCAAVLQPGECWETRLPMSFNW